jgi:phytoene dehydrogenase-like protein
VTAHPQPYDAIILGSSPNELVAACTLAKAGQRVLVVDSRTTLGGTAALEEIAPGFRAEVVSPHNGWVSPRVVRDLGLDAHGFEWSWADPCVFTPEADGPGLALWHDLGKSRDAIRKHSAADADKWEAFSTRMARLAGFLEALYTQEPPRIMSEQTGDLFTLMGLGFRLRRLGKVDMIELLRTLPMSVEDLLDDWFESDLLKATVGAGGITNIFQGPRSAGTCFVLLHHMVGRPAGAFRSRAVVKNERGHLASVLAAAAKQLGVESRTGVDAHITVEDGRATGVVLGGGEAIAARVVVSGADPKRTFTQLIDPTELGPEFLDIVKNVKLRGVRAVVNLAIGELPKLKGADEAALRGTLSFAAHLDHLEHAFDDAKHGGVSKRLFLEATIPSLDDPSLAPRGKHVMSVAVQYAPYRLKDGTWDGPAREALADKVVATLNEYAPGFGASIEGRQVLTPKDLEERFGLTEGHLYGGELTLDQILFMRPLPGWAHYRTPIEGLLMCGDSTHPGGALAGLAGANAAREILKD